MNDRAQAPVAVMWTFIALSTIFVSARLFTRLQLLNTIGLDDYIMALSLVLLQIFCLLWLRSEIITMCADHRLCLHKPCHCLCVCGNRRACLRPDERGAVASAAVQRGVLSASDPIVYDTEAGCGGSPGASHESGA